MPGGEIARLRQAAIELCRIAHDYEPGGPPSPDTVVEWAQRFPAPQQAPIVGELTTVLSRTYVARPTMRNLLGRLLDRQVFKDQNPRAALDDTIFLDLQGAGSSQRDMLEALDEVLEKRRLTRRLDDGPASTYVYLDDCVHTGNRLRYDLTRATSGETPAWIDDHAPHGCELQICVLAMHERGFDYAIRYITEAAAAKEIRVPPVRRHLPVPADATFRPVRVVNPGDALSDYLTWLDDRIERRDFRPGRYWRTDRGSVGFCETRESRDILETGLLEVGAQLRTWVAKPEMRPLGYDKLESLGSGSPFMSYRNIPNTAPVALWYGPDALFRRK